MKNRNHKEVETSQIEFNDHVRNNIIYPDLTDIEERFHNVPIRIMIGKDGELENAEYAEPKIRYPDQSWIKNDQIEYINEALRITKLYKNWVPNKVNGYYQKTDKIVTISFHYHKRMMIESDIVLNPDIRPKCLDNSWRTERTVQGKNGFDGLGNVLAIINHEGILEDLEIYNVYGKTNAHIVEGDFIALGKWSPAVFKGSCVKSQISLLIHT